MMIHHPGTGISHHMPDSFSHHRLITVDLAVRTGCFTLMEGAFVKARFCIIQKLLALMTQSLMRFMLTTTVNVYHCSQSLMLPFHPALLIRHAYTNAFQLFDRKKVRFKELYMIPQGFPYISILKTE